MTETYPPLSDRIQSTFIDTLFIVGLMFVIAGILDKMDNPPDWLRLVQSLYRLVSRSAKSP